MAAAHILAGRAPRAAATHAAPYLFAQGADLAELGREFEAAWAAERALSAEARVAPPSEGERYDLLSEAAALETKAVADRISDTPATSLDGLVIKASVARWCHSDEPIDADWLADAGWLGDRDFEGEPQTNDVKIILSILRDLAALSGSSPSTCAPAKAA